MSKSIVFGAVSGYDYSNIRIWLESLLRTGYEGDIGFLTYNMDTDLIIKLALSNRIKIIPVTKPVNGVIRSSKSVTDGLMVNRFIFAGNYLSKTDYDFAVFTDIRDVYFQKNPMDLVNRYSINDIIVRGENFTYEHEPWSKNNLLQTFGEDAYKLLKTKEIICAGAIAGGAGILSELFTQLYFMAFKFPYYIPGGGGADQSALNIILKSVAWERNVRNLPEFCLHAGTTTQAIEAGSGSIGREYTNGRKVSPYRDERCSIKGEYIANSLTVDFPAIIHQYDRVPEWKEFIRNKFK